MLGIRIKLGKAHANEWSVEARGTKHTETMTASERKGYEILLWYWGLRPSCLGEWKKGSKSTLVTCYQSTIVPVVVERWCGRFLNLVFVYRIHNFQCCEILFFFDPIAVTSLFVYSTVTGPPDQTIVD